MSGKRKAGRPAKRGRSTSNNEVVFLGKRRRTPSPKMQQHQKETSKNQTPKDKRRKQARASKKKVKKTSKITKVSLKVFPLEDVPPSFPSQDFKALKKAGMKNFYFHTCLDHNSTFASLEREVNKIVTSCDRSVDKEGHEGSYIFYRSKKQKEKDVMKADKQPQDIRDKKTWQRALDKIAYTEPDDEHSSDSDDTTVDVDPVHAFLELVVALESEEESSSEEEESEEESDEIPEHDIRASEISVHLLYPTYNVQAGIGPGNVQNTSYEIKCPQTSQFLFTIPPCETTSDAPMPFVDFRHKVLTKAKRHQWYKGNNDSHIVGKDSGIFSPTRKGGGTVVQIGGKGEGGNTEQLWQMIRDRKEKAKNREERKKVQIFVSVSAKTPAMELFDEEEHMICTPEKKEFSQNFISATPEIYTKPSHAAAGVKRNNQYTDHETLQRFVQKLYETEGCDTHHAFNQDHIDYLVRKWQNFKVDKVFAFERWQCDPTDPTGETWPRLNELPTEFLPMNAGKYFKGEVAQKGKYPPVDGKPPPGKSSPNNNEDRWSGFRNVMEPLLQAVASRSNTGQQQGTNQQQQMDDNKINVQLSYKHSDETKCLNRCDDMPIIRLLKQEKWTHFPPDQYTAMNANPPTMDGRVGVVNGEEKVVAKFTFQQLKEKTDDDKHRYTTMSLYHDYYESRARERKIPLHLQVEAYKLEKRKNFKLFEIDSD